MMFYFPDNVKKFLDDLQSLKINENSLNKSSNN